MDRAEGEGTHSYGRTSAFYQRTIFILNNKDITMIKLKNILNEAYAWERQEGKPLPTMAEVKAAYDAKMQEEARLDFLDLDGDGNETESMKSAAADSTSHGNFINKARAKSHLTKKDGHVYGHDASGKVTKLNSASDVDDAKYTKFTIKEGENGPAKDGPIGYDDSTDSYISSKTVTESLNSRILNNLKGSEYILSETFKK